MSWTLRAKVAIKQNLDAYCAEQRARWELHEAGHAHEHFTFFMVLTDFLAYFTFESL